MEVKMYCPKQANNLSKNKNFYKQKSEKLSFSEKRVGVFFGNNFLFEFSFFQSQFSIDKQFQ